MFARTAICLLTICLMGGVVEARPQYADAMKVLYPDFAKKHPDSTQKRVTCSVCHVKEGAKSNKKKRNNYGFAFGKELSKANEKDMAKINAALKKIEPAESATKGKSFLDLIKAGEKPGTNDEKK